MARFRSFQRFAPAPLPEGVDQPPPGNHPLPALWICNRLDGIDPAHVRRFDLVIEVPVPPLRAREKMLATRLDGLEVGAGCLRELAQNVNLAPSHIDKAVKVASYCGHRTPEATGNILKTIIANAHKALNFKGKKGFGYHLDASYSLAHVNTDHDLEGLAKCCRKLSSVRLFLYGPPETGKTAFVQYFMKRKSLMHEKKSTAEQLFTWLEQEVASKRGLQKGLVGF